MSLEEQVVNLLMKYEYHITCAESCTGGLLAGRLVNVPNVSKVFDTGFITYANDAKVKYLGVSPVTISEYGVVSEEVAAQMAVGVAKEVDAEIGIGISGIAGPTGGTDKKPVGMVCFGFSFLGYVTTSTKYFTGLSRNEVREKSVDYVLTCLLELLKPA